MEKISSHRDLIVWQKAMDLAVIAHAAAGSLPKIEQFALSQQLRRAAVSVPANIAEGNARSSTKDYAHFLSIARGSLMETETLLDLARRLAYLNDTELEPAISLIVEIDKMLLTIRRKLIESLGEAN